MADLQDLIQQAKLSRAIALAKESRNLEGAKVPEAQQDTSFGQRLLQSLAMTGPGQAITRAITTPKEDYLGLARSAIAGPTFGFGEEIEAKLASALTNVPYEQELVDIRGQQEAFREKYPVTSLATEIGTGLALNPLASLGTLAKASKLPAAAKQAQKLVTGAPTQAFVAGFGEGEGGVAERVKTGLLTGAVGTTSSIASDIIGRTFHSTANQADRLLSSSFGLRPSDFARSLKEMTMRKERAAKPSEISLIKSLRKFRDKNVVAEKLPLITNAANLHEVTDNLGKELDNVLNKLNNASEPFADFTNEASEQYINKLSGKARDTARDKIAEEREAIISQFENGGSILDLQKAKVGLNYAYDDNPLTETIQKAIRQDLRREIEDRAARMATKKTISKDLVKKLKNINSEYGDAVELRNVFLKRSGVDLGGNTVEDFFKLLRTSGGGGSTFVAAAGAKDPRIALIGLGASALRGKESLGALADVIDNPLAQALLRGGGTAIPMLGSARAGAQTALGLERQMLDTGE